MSPVEKAKLTWAKIMDAHGVPQDRRRRVIAVMHFVNNAEDRVGGVLTGGATIEEANVWRCMDFTDAADHEDVTEDDMHELEGYGLASFDRGTWRVRPTKLGVSA